MKEKTYFETFNLRNVKYLRGLSLKELTELLKQNSIDKSGKKIKVTPEYVSYVKDYLKKIIKYDGPVPVKYKYGKDCTSGRLFGKGLSLQSIPNNIRDFIRDDEYFDYDMINAHPSMILHLAKNNPKIKPCSYLLLEQYVDKRDTILVEHGFTKQDLLIALYSDTMPKSINNIKFLKGLFKEFKVLKEELTIGIKTDNTKNPNSSCLSRLICELENTILQKVLNNCIDSPIECALCFDGFLCKEEISTETLDKITEEYGVRWKIKPRNNTITIPDDFNPDEYTQLKAEFENKNFMVVYPLCFYHLVDDNWRIFNEAKFTTINKPLPKINGKPFVATWLCDPMRLEYSRTDFFPYNKNPPNIPSNVFNTFVPFKRLQYIDEPKHKNFTRFLEMFNQLMYNLCERDPKMQEFLLFYIAHMVQYPDVLPQTIIYLKGIQGIGKDTLIDIIQLLISNEDYILRCKSLEQIFGRFNFGCGGNLVIDVNEMSNTDAITYKEHIKDFSTRKTNNIETKGVDGFSKLKNCIRLFIKSNDNKPVCLTESSRREFVVEGYPISLDSTTVDKFFEEFHPLVQTEEIINNLFAHLNNIDLSKFNVRKPPRGQLFSELQTNNVKPIFNWLRLMECNGVAHHKDGDVLYLQSDLIKNYTSYCKENNISKNLILTPQSMNDELSSLRELMVKKQTSVKRVKGYYWKFNENSLKNYINQKYFKYQAKIDTIDENDIVSADECEITEDY
jgi:hypothetical protein